MKYQLIIETDTIDELSDIFKQLKFGSTIPLKSEEIIPTHVKDPDTGEIHSIYKSSQISVAANIAICKQCGIEFEPQRKDSKFCSKKCYMKDYWLHYKTEDSKKKAK